MPAVFSEESVQGRILVIIYIRLYKTLRQVKNRKVFIGKAETLLPASILLIGSRTPSESYVGQFPGSQATVGEAQGPF